MPSLRDFQQEDFEATLAALEKNQCVLGRAATGLGKAVVLAALAKHYSQFGRVMILVDVKKLVRQLADTITWFTGMRPGIEMADERAINTDTFCAPDQIVVSTVQTQYSGPLGKERYRKVDVSEYSFLGLDETELFLAPKAREVVDWYLGNKNLKCAGVTATPLRGDGVAMANLFQDLAFDRDIIWGINNGWLVPAKQAFVRVNVDFSTLAIRKGADGEADYSDEQIAEKIASEQTQIELAKGIAHVAGDRKSIVVCPTVATAIAVSDHICAQGKKSRVIYGEMSDEEKDETFAAFARNEFQVLSSVNMVVKGFDDPEVSAVFNCRKTKSKRLYTQALGRGTRPLRGILEGLTTPQERINAIAASAKTNTLMVNLVGVDEEVRDITIVDILGTADEEVIEAAKKIVQETGVDTETALEQAAADVDAVQEAERLIAEAEEELQEGLEERQMRSRISIKADVEVEYRDGLDASGNMQAPSPVNNDRQLNILRKAKVPESVIAKMAPADVKNLSRELIRRWKTGLCSYSQGKTLKRSGYEKSEIKNMTRDQASQAIDSLAKNGWKRQYAA